MHHPMTLFTMHAYLYKIPLYRHVSLAVCEGMKETIKHITIYSFPTEIFSLPLCFLIGVQYSTYANPSKINVIVLFLTTKYH